MRKLSLVLVVVLLMMSMLSMDVAAKKPAPEPESEPVAAEAAAPCVFSDVQELIAGQYTRIGWVYFDSDGYTLKVRYEIDQMGWSIPLSHVYVGETTHKNWAPGQFDYQHEHQGDEVFGYEYQIDISGMTNIIVAAHCESEYYSAGGGDIEAEAAKLPPCVQFDLGYPGGSSYITITVDDTALAGVFEGWCIDGEADIWPGNDYYACVSSSYDYYENGLAGPLNYLVNVLAPAYPETHMVPDPASPTGEKEILKWSTVQYAIWVLTDTVPDTIYDPAFRNSYSQADAEAMAQDALDNGQGYEPGCDERLVVVLEPVDSCDECGNPNGNQPMIISVPVECTEEGEGEETAWARGATSIDFDKKWGWYTDFSCTQD